MSSSPEARGFVAAPTSAPATAVRLARIDADLRRDRFAGGVSDPRLTHPVLQDALVEAAEEARQQARAAGYAAGYAEGRRVAAVETAAEVARGRAAREQADRYAAARLDAVVTALQTAAAGLEQAAHPAVEHVAGAVVDAALELTRTLLAREVATAAEPGRDVLVRVLAACPASDPVVVRMNPDDAATLVGVDLEALSAQVSPDGVHRPVRVVPDAGVRPGDALADCGPTRVDARLDTALDRVREVLSS